MASKSKDLFVLLQERQNQGQRRPSKGGKGKAGKTRSGRGGAARGKAGATLGSWFQGVLQTVRKGREPEGRGDRAAGRHAGGAGTGPGSRAAARRVPRGLFSGAFVAGALLLGFAGGVGVGKLWQGDPAQAGGRDLNAGPQAPGAFQAEVGKSGSGNVLDSIEEERRLGEQCYILGVYQVTERHKAARLAAWARSQGIDSARITRWKVTPKDPSKGSKVAWCAICFPADVGHETQQKTLLGRLHALPSPEFLAGKKQFPLSDKLRKLPD